MTFFMLALTFACSDYEVRSLRSAEPVNWFDEASDRYQGALDSVDEDTGSSGQMEEYVPDPPKDDESDLDVQAEGDSEDRVPDNSNEESGSGDDEGSVDGLDWGDIEDDEWADTGVIPGYARGPGPGEVIVSELMIYPRASDDNVGEWVEFRNVGSVWMDLSGYRLADRGVDDTEIVPMSIDSLFVAPGDYLIICAESDYWSNGGVECDGTFHYWTLGGGFALANAGDEVRLLTPDGHLVDEVAYGEGFASEGEAVGLPPSVTSSVVNDDEEEWCDQRTLMSFGDAGTPGVHNDLCW